MSAADQRAWVEVDEIKILATGGGADWWTLYRMRGPASRFTVVRAGFPGDVVRVECDNAEDADWLVSFMVQKGIHKKAIAVKKTAAGAR